ncbi:MAG: energy transducer TonB [Sedimentisphaerales bacterium]|nr:energy transducer TonB [Sedimentisphaerales bacterium]
MFHEVRHRLWALLGAAGLTLAFFTVLPLMQSISRPPAEDLLLQSVDVSDIPPPSPPPEEEVKEETESAEKPPELVETAPPLDLSQLELALDPALGDGLLGSGDFAVRLSSAVANSSGKGGGDADAIFSIADLDQTPRPIYQASPTMTREARQKAPGKVNVIFVVDEQGRVVDARIRSSTDPVFEQPALNAVKRWKFEPGRRAGRAVRFRMLAPISFPKG